MEATDPRFRMPPELGPPEKDVRGPELQRVQAKSSLAVSQARPQGVGCRRNQTPASQLSRGEAVGREQNGGFFESSGLSRILRE